MKQAGTLLLSIAILTSCGQSNKDNEHNREIHSTSYKFEGIKNNLELTKIVLRTLPSHEREVLTQEISKLSPEEIKIIFENANKMNFKLATKYYYPDDQIIYHNELLKTLITHTENSIYSNFSYENQLHFQAISYIQSKSLNEIISNFENRSLQLIDEIKGDLILELTQDLSLGHEMLQMKKLGNKNDFIQKLVSQKKFIEAIDKYFKNSKLNQTEQNIVVIASLSAAAIYPLVKDSPSLHSLIEKAKKIGKELKKINEKKKEIMALTSTLEKHFNNTEKSFKKLKEGLIKTKESATKAKEQSKNFNGKPEFKHFIKEVERHITGKVDKAKGDNPSVISNPIYINEGVKQSVEAVGEISQNLGNIVNTAQNLANTLGIKLSRSSLDILDTAKKISDTTTIANTVITGLASGGVLGALNAFSALGSTSSFMAGGSSAMDGVMNAKLDAILENQKQIMQMQLETMQMVKDLALMVDSYHAQEMYALESIEIVNTIQSKMLNNILNSKVNSCNQIIDDHLYEYGKNKFSMNEKLKASINFSDYPLIRDSLKSIKNFADIKSLIRADRDNWMRCLSSFDDVFTSALYENNSILKFYETENIAHFKRYEDHVYSRILKTYRDLFRKEDSDDFTYFMHSIATGDYHGALLKEDYIRSFQTNGQKEALNIKNLISTKYLERYVTHLLWSIPYFKIRATDTSLEQAIKRQVKEGSIREIKLLKQALFLTRSAIAQQIIQVGEPFIRLAERTENFNSLFSDDGCKEEIDNLCFFRSNKILMQNLLNFYLYQKLSSQAVQENYESARIKKDTEYLDQVFGDRKVRYTKNKDGIQISLNRPEIKSSFELTLPSLDTILSAQIIYPHELNTLIKMQEALIEEITKLESRTEVPNIPYLWLTL